MRYIIQASIVLFLSYFVQGQDNRELDSICLHLTSQEFALNQNTLENIQFESILKTRKAKKELRIIVPKQDSLYFFASSWVLKPDTVKEPSRSGEIMTEVYRGADYVLGIQLEIQNNTNNYTHVPIEDNQMVLIQEAKDSVGNWRPIEYFLHSSCGNSYSGFNIPPNMSYKFMVARYCGEFKTKLRI